MTFFLIRKLTYFLKYDLTKPNFKMFD